MLAPPRSSTLQAHESKQGYLPQDCVTTPPSQARKLGLELVTWQDSPLRSLTMVLSWGHKLRDGGSVVEPITRTRTGSRTRARTNVKQMPLWLQMCAYSMFVPIGVWGECLSPKAVPLDLKRLRRSKLLSRQRKLGASKASGSAWPLSSSAWPLSGVPMKHPGVGVRN